MYKILFCNEPVATNHEPIIVDGNFPLGLISNLVFSGSKIIIISTYSKTIKTPYIKYENGEQVIKFNEFNYETSIDNDGSSAVLDMVFNYVRGRHGLHLAEIIRETWDDVLENVEVNLYRNGEHNLNILFKCLNNFIECSLLKKDYEVMIKRYIKILNQTLKLF